MDCASSLTAAWSVSFLSFSTANQNNKFSSEYWDLRKSWKIFTPAKMNEEMKKKILVQYCFNSIFLSDN